jgi:hypothetical protein
MEIKCPICKLEHNVQTFEICNNFFSTLIQKYISLNLEEIKNEINKIPYKKNNLKFKCDNCGKQLSSKANYNNHIQSNICKRLYIFKCELCDTVFKCKQNLNKHITKNICGNINKNNTLTSVPNTTNITNNNNNSTNTTNNMTNSQNTTNIGTLNNNIQINVNANSTEDLKKVVNLLPFRENGYKVSTEKYLEYANNPEHAIKQFIKEHHFNPDKPERLNILNTNRRDNRVQLFDYDEDSICRWQTKDKSKIIELLYDRGMNHLFFAKMMLDGAGVKLDPKKEKKLKEKIKEYEDEKVKKQCLDMISDMTYDYREIVETNKKKIEKQQKLLT